MRKVLAFLALFAYFAPAQASEWRTIYETPKVEHALFVPPITFIAGTSVAGFTNLQTFAGTPGSNTVSGTRTYINKIQNGAFGTASSGFIRLSVCSVASTGAVTANTGVCTGTSSPNAWSCAAAATRITWSGGSSSFSLSAGEIKQSDDVAYVLDSSNPLTIAFDGVSLTSSQVPKIPISYGSSCAPAAGSNCSNTTPPEIITGCGGAACFVSYFSGSGQQSAVTGSTARGSVTTTANNSYFLCKVEVRP